MSAACGFAHQYKPLDAEDLPLVLANYWHELGLAARSRRRERRRDRQRHHPDHRRQLPTDRATHDQVARVMEIKQLDTLDPDVIHAALTLEDVVLHPTDGLHVRLRRSKTDQEARGTVKALPYGRDPATCPPCAYVRWRQILQAWDTAADGASRRAVLPVLRRQAAMTVAGGGEEQQDEPVLHCCRSTRLLGRPTGEPFQPTEGDRDAVEAALRGLPSHGWTQGMFGRRDRCLLVLSQLAGVPYQHLATTINCPAAGAPSFPAATPVLRCQVSGTD